MREFKTRDEYINAEVSEKITLVHLTCSVRLYSFSNPSSNVYTKSTNYIVTDIKNFTKRNDSSVADGEWYFDIPTNTLYIGSTTAIEDVKIIADYRLLFSDAPVKTTWDLINVSSEVEYEARVLKAPQFKSSVGTNQKGTSFTNSGQLELENNDGYFDDIYDSLVYENKEVTVYSWNRSINPSDAKLIFKGNIYDKSFTSKSVSFQIKNSYTRIEESLVLDQYSLSDGVSSEYVGQFKRRIYGRVNELLVRSIDQIGSGYQITGTVSTNITANAQATGIGTNLSGELIVNDKVEIDSQEFTVVSIGPGETIELSSDDPIYTRGDRTSFSKITETSLSGVITSNILTPRTITGSGTLFTTELSNGDVIKIDGYKYTIDNITNNTTLTIDTDILQEFSGRPYTKYDTSSLSGDLTFDPPARTVTGSGTTFLDEISPGDTLTFNTFTFAVEDVIDDTTLIVDGDVAISSNISNVTAINKPELPWRKKNRKFLVSGHALYQFETTIVSSPQLNRINVVDASGFSAGDVVAIYNGSTFIQNAEILRIINNQLTFKVNFPELYPNGYTIQNRPLSNIFIDTIELNINDLKDITNTTSGCTFEIEQDSEFNIANSKNIPVNFQFNADSRTITLATAGYDNLTEVIKTRDFVKFIGDPDTYFAEVLKVESNTITLRTPYKGGSRIGTLTYRSPATIGDSSNVTVNCTGKTDDGTPSGNLMTRGPEIIKDILEEIGLSSIMNLSSFDDAKIDAPYSIGISIPEEITSTSLPTVKDIVDKISRTITGALTIDNDLLLSYSIFNAQKDPNKNFRLVRYDDLKDWKIKSRSGNLYRRVNASYNFKDYDNSSKTKDKDVIIVTSEFVEDFDTSNKTDEIELYVDNEKDALELAERYVYINSLSQANIELVSDLRLSDLSIGQNIVLEIPRLYKRLGDPTTRNKICTVTGIEITGKETRVTVSDLGSIFNRSGVITPDSANEYDIASASEKLYDTYITEDNGSINQEDGTANVNLIF